MSLKAAVKRVIEAGVAGMDGTRVGRFVYDRVLGTAMRQTRVIEHGDTKLIFAIPNALNEF